MSVQYFEGRFVERKALRSALQFLNAQSKSDQIIANVLATYVEQDRVHDFPSNSTRPISRATISRVRRATDKELKAIKTPTIGVIYNFLCHCIELKTNLFEQTVRIQSTHKLAPLLEALHKFVPAREGLLTDAKLKSFVGTFHLYRKAWTSLNAETYIRSVMRFEWVGNALFYTEEQKFYDTVDKSSMDEMDIGVVFPFGMNVVLLGNCTSKDLLKFFSIDEFSVFPNEQQKIQSFAGNFIAVYGKWEHPVYKAYAKRVKEGEEAKSKFYAPNTLAPEILEKLKG